MVKKPRPLWQVLLADLLALCLILVTFAFFHHGRAYLQLHLRSLSSQEAEESSVSSLSSGLDTEEASSVESASSSDSSSLPEEDAAADSSADPAEESSEACDEYDDRTEWQIKFADQFTDEVVQSYNHYSSPDVSLTVHPYVLREGSSQVRYYVADIYVSCIECFRTYLADNVFELYQTQPILDMDLASDALLAMTGDFYSYQYSGLMVRNGTTYRSDYTYSDICVLYKDGTMETLKADTYDRHELLEEDIWQLWNFGPALLDEDGSLPSRYNVSETVSYINPRSSIGYYEPGHYCFVVVDGRQDDWSVGMTLPELSQLYYDLGCKAAYNLDGGGSAVMTFDDEVISHQSNGADRELGDILLIAEPDTYDPAADPAAP